MQVITDNDIQQPVQLLDSVATALTRAGMHDRAGDFYERLEELQRALDSYIRGSAYRKAVELARRSFPGRVVELQEQWGDYLVRIVCIISTQQIKINFSSVNFLIIYPSCRIIEVTNDHDYFYNFSSHLTLIFIFKCSECLNGTA